MLQRFAEFVSTGFYSGYLPKAPGTWGTLVTVPLVWLLWHLDPVWWFVSTVAVTCLGIWSADVTARALGLKDPGMVVIDEMAGYMVAMLPFAAGWPALLIAFVVFRGFDILKPFPLRRLEALPGGQGIMYDDLGAGVYTAIVMLALAFIWPGLLSGPGVELVRGLF